MVGVVKNLFGLTKKKHTTFHSRKELIRRESEIGRQVFGAIPKGHRREFFCLDKHTWVWYEEWVDKSTSKRRSITTRYEVHPRGILKIQDGQPYQYLTKAEGRNLARAVELYYHNVSRHVYNREPQQIPHIQPA